MAMHLKWNQIIHYDTNDTVSMPDFYLCVHRSFVKWQTMRNKMAFVDINWMWWLQNDLSSHNLVDKHKFLYIIRKSHVYNLFNIFASIERRPNMLRTNEGRTGADDRTSETWQSFYFI